MLKQYGVNNKQTILEYVPVQTLIPILEVLKYTAVFEGCLSRAVQRRAVYENYDPPGQYPFPLLIKTRPHSSTNLIAH